ncbi:MAG: hypothetical protein WD823_00085 [Sulfuricaulis sp.]|uniref:hypothetical protein n=1 Tax=Sulfuricaulis sp. TaxID=2003553 RepID=UPI0034A4CFA4
MEAWNEAKLDVGFYDDQRALLGLKCSVRVVASSLSISCLFLEEEVALHGLRNGQGHYHMVASNGSMQATLHRFKDSQILEGFWTRRGRRGFWRIQLPEVALAAEATKAPARKKTTAVARAAPKKRKRSPAIAA